MNNLPSFKILVTALRMPMLLLLALLMAACGADNESAVPTSVPAASSPAATRAIPTTTPLPSVEPFAPQAVLSETAASEEAACAVSTPCVEDSGEAQAIDNAIDNAIDARLATLYEGVPFRGVVLVARQGEVIFERAYGQADTDKAIANTPETRFRLGSITKSITASAVLKLQAAGLVDVTASVCTYLPECPAAWQAITLHQLLSHTSGIPDLTRFPDFGAGISQAADPAQLLARFADRPLDFAPGTAWDYSNSNYIVLGSVIEQVTGQTYADYLRDAIFAPLGMDATGYDLMDGSTAVGYLPDGSPAAYIHMSIPYAAGGLVSTVGDMAILVRALVEDKLLPADLREQMWTAHAAIPGPGPAQSYGYGWTVTDGPQGKAVGHNGSIEGFSAGLRYYLEPDLLIVVLSNEERRDPNRALDGIAEIVLP